MLIYVVLNTMNLTFNITKDSSYQMFCNILCHLLIMKKNFYGPTLSLQFITCQVFVMGNSV